MQSKPLNQCTAANCLALPLVYMGDFYTFAFTFTPPVLASFSWPFSVSHVLVFVIVLKGTATRGDAAATFQVGIPLLIRSADRNLLEVYVSCVPVTALIDSGAPISANRAYFHRRLTKVLTKVSCVRRVNDGRTMAVSGICAVRVSSTGYLTFVIFPVLEERPNDVI